MTTAHHYLAFTKGGGNMFTGIIGGVFRVGKMQQTYDHGNLRVPPQENKALLGDDGG